MLQLLAKLFGKSYLNKIMGTRTNVAKPTRMDENSPFKKYSDDAFNDPKAIDYIEKKINEYGPYALSNKNPQEIANFEANAQRLLAAKNRQTGTTQGMVDSMKPKPEAEIIDIGTGKKIDDEGIMTLKKRAPQIDTKASANLEEDIAKLSDRQAREYSANIESYRRPIVRQLLLKDTKIKLPDDVRKSLENKMDLQKGADPKMDPLRLLDEYYEWDMDKLDVLEDIRFTARDEFEAADEFLKKGGLEPKKDLGEKLKDLPDDIDPDALANGGRPGFRYGSGKGLLKYLQSKLGKKNRQLTKNELEEFEDEIGDGLEAYDFDGTVVDAERILKEDEAYKAEMFAEYKAEGGSKRAGGPNDPMKKAMDEVGGNMTGDLKYDAEVLASELAFQRGLIPEGGDLSDIADQMKQMDLYDEAYSAVSGVFKKQREIKKLSKPTQTLKSIKEKGTIDIGDENVMGEFDTFMREADPEGYEKLEGITDKINSKTRTDNASGGLNYLMGL